VASIFFLSGEMIQLGYAGNVIWKLYIV